MRTSELREIAGFYGCDGRTRWFAAEVIRLREALAAFIAWDASTAKGVDSITEYGAAIDGAVALLTEHDEPSNIPPQVGGSCDDSRPDIDDLLDARNYLLEPLLQEVKPK